MQVASEKRKPFRDDVNVLKQLKIMDSSQTKTPVMLLQEICAKRVNNRRSILEIILKLLIRILSFNLQNPKDLPLYTEVNETPEEYEEQNMRFFTKVQAFGREVN